MKKISIVILLLVALISTMALTACGVDEYTITFESNGGSSVASITVSDIEDLVIPANPTRDGYTFDGWYTDSAFGVQFDSSVMIDSDITLYAKWVESAVQLDTYTVVFYNGEASTSVTVTEGNKATAPTDPTMDSTAEFTYTFVEWNSALDGSGTAFDSTSVVTANAMYYAQFQSTTNQYTVTFYDSDGTTVLYTADFDYGTTPAYVGDEPTKTATDSTTYAFAGWGTITTVTEDTSYTAQFSDTAMQYTYTFYDSDGTTVLSTETVDYGTTIVAPATPTKDSTAEHTYTFDNWYTALTDGVVVEDFGTLTADVSYYAQYKSTTNQYTVKFDSDGGSDVTSLTTDYNTAVTKPTDPTLSGYTFDGWYLEDSNTAFDFSTAITANIELTAKWTEVAVLYELDAMYVENDSNVLTAAALLYGYGTDAEGLASAKEEIKFITVSNDTDGWLSEMATILDDEGITTEELVCMLVVGNAIFLQFDGELSFDEAIVSDTLCKSHGNILYFSDYDMVYYALFGAGINLVEDSTQTAYYSDDGTVLYCAYSIDGNLTIAEGVLHICHYAFANCSNVETLSLPASVTNLLDVCWKYCTSVATIEVDEASVYYKDIDGSLYTADGTTLVRCAVGNTATSFSVPDGVITIAEYAFYGSEYLESIHIASTVKYIGNYAFSHADIVNITFGVDSQLISIGEGAFFMCNYLDSIAIPSSVECIADMAFFGCLRLTSVTIGDDSQLVSIGIQAFAICNFYLSSIVIPESVQYIGYKAFDDCSNLTIYCEATSQPDGWDSEWNYNFYGEILWSADWQEL